MKRTWLICEILILLLVAVAGLPRDVEAQPRTAVLEDGSAIQVRLSEFLSSETNQPGDRFNAILDEDLTIGGWLVAPAGSIVTGEVTRVADAEKVRGRAMMELTLRELQVEGQRYSLSTNAIRVEAEGSKKEDATIIGGGAGIGALLGAIMGGKKGAVLGAVIGAGAGTTAVLVTEGEDVEFESEQRFRFFLQRDVRMDVLGRDADFDREDDPQDQDDPYFANREFDPQTEDEIERSSGNLREASRRLVDDIAQELRNQGSFRNLSQAETNRRVRLYFELNSFASAAERFDDWTDHLEAGLLQETFRSLHDDEQEISKLMQQNQSRSLNRRWQDVSNAMADLSRAFDRGTADRDSDFFGDRASSGRLHWKGIVDGQDYIMLQNDDVSIRHLKGQRVSSSDFNLTSALPQTEVELKLRKIQGRGEISIMQPPSRWNNYTAIILVDDDRQSGSDWYEFELSWERK